MTCSSTFRDDKSLRVAIITGAGEKFFSPGWDLKAAAGGEKSDEDWGVSGFGGTELSRAISTSRSSRRSTASPAGAASRSFWALTSS